MKSQHLFPRMAFIIALTALMAGCSTAPAAHIHYLGHASFLLQFDNGLTVLTDYGDSSAYGLNSPVYSYGGEEPDIVTYSHDHADHRREISWQQARVLTGTDSLDQDGLEILPIRTCEINPETPDNTSYLFTYKGLSILHLADAQSLIQAVAEEAIQEQVKALYPARYDVLLLTIEGVTQFIPQAEAFIDLLQPGRVIPMHYWSPEYKAEFLSYLEDQNRASGRQYRVERTGGPGYDLTGAEGDENEVRIISLDPAAFLDLD